MIANQARLRIHQCGQCVPLHARDVLHLLDSLGVKTESGKGNGPLSSEERSATLTLLLSSSTQSLGYLLGEVARLKSENPLVLGPRIDSESVVRVLASGATDYVFYSREPKEVVARILALARRTTSGVWSAPTPKRIEHGLLTLEIDARELKGPSGTVVLTETEMRLALRLKKSSAGAAELAVDLLGRRDNQGRGRDLVYRHVANLKHKLQRVGGAQYLEKTSRGYGLVDPRTVDGV